MELLEPASDVRSRTRLEFLWLEITSKCNLECIHCYADSGPQKDLTGRMTLADWLAVLHEAADAQCTAVQFIGGEPTMHPDLTKMVMAAKRAGYQLIEIFTNASFVKPEQLVAFREANVRIAVSFYSDDPDVHDEITQRKGSFVRTVAGIKRYIDAGLQVRAGVIETPVNPGHAYNAARLLRDIGVSTTRFDVQREIGRGARQPVLEHAMSALCGQCSQGRLCVTATGSIHPCVFSRFAQVGSADAGIADALGSTALSRFRSELDRFMQRQVATCGPLQCGPTCSPGNFRCSPGSFCGPLSKCMPETLCGPDTAIMTGVTGP